MIGSGLKKFAQENGMTVANGVAYGRLKGFNATMSEGNNYKRITFATNFKDLAMKGAFTACLEKANLQKNYRINGLQSSNKFITVVFYDTIGTMKRIRTFVDWFTDLLVQYEATPANICLGCGAEITNGSWVMIDDICYYMHDTCADRLKGEVENYNEEKKDALSGSYVTGTIGALVGAALGAVVWALVLMMGYVASLVGVLIGWLSQFGYNLFKGRQGKGKLLILALAIIAGVVLGTIASDMFQLVEMIDKGEIIGYTYGEIPDILIEQFTQNEEYRSAVIKNTVIGLLFAALGVLPMLKQTSNAVANKKFKKM